MKRELKKISTDHAKIGMFVESIDRPVNQTPFPPQGFHIKTEDELLQVKYYCKTINIDKLKSALINATSQSFVLAPYSPRPEKPVMSQATAEKIAYLRKKRNKKGGFPVFPVGSLLTVFVTTLYWLQSGISLVS